MNKANKVISLLFIVLICITSNCVYADDVQKKSLAETLNILIDFDETQPLKKEQLARMAVSMYLGGTDLSTMDSYVEFACNGGFIEEEYSDFNHNENVTSAELMTAFAKSLGYFGYNSVASSAYMFDLNDLFKGIKFGDVSAVTVAEALKAAENALNMNVLDGEMGNLEISEKTLLESKFNVSSISGILVSARAKDRVNNNDIYIGDKLFVNNSNTDYSEFEGYKVRAYYTDENGAEELVYADTDYYKNETLTVYASDIISVKDGVLYYLNKNEAEKRIKISEITTLFYNGSIEKYNMNYFDIESGNIVFIDDGKGYKTALINKYDDMVLGIFSDNILYDIKQSGLMLDLDKLEYYEIIFNGRAVETDVLKKNDILSIFLSKDKKTARIFVSRNELSGTVSSVRGSDIYIDNMQYKISRYLRTNYDIKIGEAYIFGTNFNGDIITGNIISEYQYGYFMHIWKDEDQEKLCIRLLNSKGDIEVLTISEKLNINGVRFSKPNINDNNILVESLKKHIQIDSEGNIKLVEQKDYVRQIIKYRINEKGEVTNIVTATADAEENKSDKLRIVEAGKTSEHRLAGIFLGSAFYSPTDSVVFHVPIVSDNQFDEYGYVNSELRNSISRDAYMCTSAETTGLGEGTYTVYTFDVTEGGMAKCMVINNESVGGTAKEVKNLGDSIFIVSDIQEVYDEDEDEVVYQLTGMYNKAEASYNFQPGFIFQKDSAGKDILPEPGDIVQIELDSKKRIYAMTIHFKISEKVVHRKGYSGSEYGDDCGYIYSADEYGMKMYAKENDASDFYYTSFYTLNTWYHYDLDKDIVTSASKEDIKTYKQTRKPSFVYVRTIWGRPAQCVIYD